MGGDEGPRGAHPAPEGGESPKASSQEIDLGVYSFFLCRKSEINFEAYAQYVYMYLLSYRNNDKTGFSALPSGSI